jgi:excisionase family DNA binding protein
METGSNPVPLMKSRDVAAYLGVDLRTLSKYVAEGSIPSVLISSGARRFIRAEVEQWVKNGQQVGRRR